MSVVSLHLRLYDSQCHPSLGYMYLVGIQVPNILVTIFHFILRIRAIVFPNRCGVQYPPILHAVKGNGMGGADWSLPG